MKQGLASETEEPACTKLDVFGEGCAGGRVVGPAKAPEWPVLPCLSICGSVPGSTEQGLRQPSGSLFLQGQGKRHRVWDPVCVHEVDGGWGRRLPPWPSRAGEGGGCR